MPLSPGAATLAVIGVLALGIYGARWWAAEREQDAAGARQRAAGRAVWRARRAILIAGVIVFVLGYLWVHGKGRG